MEDNNQWIAQLALPGMALEIPEEIAGVEMKLIRGYLIQLQALDLQMAEIKEAIKELKNDMAEDGVPVKTVMAALSIVKQREKARGDSSSEMLAACIVLAESLMQKEEYAQ